jgi:hypothetical protein
MKRRVTEAGQSEDRIGFEALEELLSVRLLQRAKSCLISFSYFPAATSTYFRLW